MRLIYLSPTDMSISAAAAEEKEKRRAFLQRLVPAGVEIRIVDNPGGPLSIQTMRDEFCGVPGMLHAIEQLNGQADGVLVGCFGEPGLEAVREKAKIPILGCCGPAIHLANQIGKRFSVLSPVESCIPFTTELVEKYALAGHMAPMRALNIPVLEIRQNRKKALEQAVAVANRAVQSDGADTLVLGCMSMAFQDMAGEIESTLHLPVINPIYVAIHQLIFMVRYHIIQSPKIY